MNCQYGWDLMNANKSFPTLSPSMVVVMLHTILMYPSANAPQNFFPLKLRDTSHSFTSLNWE